MPPLPLPLLRDSWPDGVPPLFPDSVVVCVVGGAVVVVGGVVVVVVGAVVVVVGVVAVVVGVVAVVWVVCVVCVLPHCVRILSSTIWRFSASVRRSPESTSEGRRPARPSARTTAAWEARHSCWS